MTTPSLVTIPNVPIAIVGVDYPAATGPVSFGPEDFISAIAALDDPEIRQPTLKLGHSGPLTSDQPVFGKLLNLAYNEIDQTLYADLVGVPSWLAKVMPYAYPSRSIEGWSDFETQHSTHKFVLTGLALLGDKWPGVTNLPDLSLMFGDEIPEIVLNLLETDMKINMASRGIAASLPVEDVRLAFYNLPEVETNYALWISQILIDPNELIVRDDDSGKLHRIPFAVKGSDVEFGDWTEVRIEYVNAVSGTKTDATRKVFATKAESRPDNDNKEQDMGRRSKLAKFLGLSSDASEEDIDKALDEQIDGRDDEPADEVEEDEEETDEEETDEEEVTLSREEFEELKSNALRGASAFEAMRTTERDNAIKAAVADGRIPPSMVKSYTMMWDRDAEAIKKELSALKPGTVPVDEIGRTPDGTEAVEASYNKSWLSAAERKRIDAARSGAVGVITDAKER